MNDDSSSDSSLDLSMIKNPSKRKKTSENVTYQKDRVVSNDTSPSKKEDQKEAEKMQEMVGQKGIPQRKQNKPKNKDIKEKFKKLYEKENIIKRNQFTFPVQGSIIALRLESLSSRDILPNTRRSYSSYVVFGIVEKVVNIKAYHVTVETKYIDKRKFGNVKLNRKDDLLFSDYGYMKNWYIRNIPDENIDGHKEDHLKKDLERDFQLITNEKTINANHNPLYFRRKHEQKAIHPDIRCNHCNGPENWTLEKGEMVICDECNLGYHQHCLNPVLLAIPSGKWFCPTCKNKMKSQKST